MVQSVGILERVTWRDPASREKYALQELKISTGSIKNHNGVKQNQLGLGAAKGSIYNQLYISGIVVFQHQTGTPLSQIYYIMIDVSINTTLLLPDAQLGI